VVCLGFSGAGYDFQENLYAVALSPVASVSGLFFWLDSVSDKSFDTDINDGDLISNWYDINPQSTLKTNFTQSDSARPTYRSSGINGLPSVEFDGSSNSMVNTSFSFPYNNYSIFIVFKTTDLTVNNPFVITYDSVTDTLRGIVVDVDSTGALRVVHRSPLANTGGVLSGSAGQIFLNKNYIVSYVRNGSTGSSTVRINSSSTNSISDTPPQSNLPGDTVTIKIGAGASGTNFTNGNINEIIIFNRALKNLERTAIEQYLSSKWGIALNT